MDTKHNFLIYGSYGYTGSLIAEMSLKQGLKPVLGGRNENRLRQQAQALNLEYRVFDLDNQEQTESVLKEFIAVVHCAGPFRYTFKQMAEACLNTKTHYIDINGEIMVFEQLMAMNERAKSSQVMLLPGAGFDVVPSDCLGLYLKKLLPDASKLIIALTIVKKKLMPGRDFSHGTSRTMLEGISEGSKYRDNGVIKTVPLSWRTRNFDFGEKKQSLCSMIAWGDVASAWWSTGIPNIETYMALPKKMIKFNRLINPIRSIFSWSPIKRYFENKLNQLPAGPSYEERQNSEMKIYGEVSTILGEVKSAVMTTPNGYELTALSVLLIIQKVLAGNAPIGFQTPSSAYTENLVLELPGVTRVDL